MGPRPCPRRPPGGWSTSSSCATPTAASRRSTTRPTRSGSAARSATSRCCSRPDYRRAGLAATCPAREGTWRELTVPAPALGAEVDVRIWSPTTGAGDRVAGRPRRPGVRQAGRARPLQRRDGRAGRSAAPPRAARAGRPRTTGTRPTRRTPRRWPATSCPGCAASSAPAGRPVVGMGASLGALAMLHAQRRYPARSPGCSCSPAASSGRGCDRQESGFRVLPPDHPVHRAGGARPRSPRTPVPTVLTCGTVEENLANNREMADALRRQGYPAELARGARRAQLHAWRDAFDPHLTDLLAESGCERRMREHSRRAVLAGDRRGRQVVCYGHYGRPVLVFPSEQGQAVRLRQQRHGRRGRRPRRGRPGQALLRRLVRRRRPGPAATCRWRSGPAGTAAYESWIVDQVVPFIARRQRRRRRHRHHRLLDGRLPRAQLRVQARRPVPARDVLLRQLRPVGLARLGRARRRGVLQQPGRLRRQPARRPPRLAARRGCRCCWCAGRASGRTPPARWTRPSAWPGCSAEKGIRHELDLWGHDVPHDWPSWRAQFAHHLPRFC